MSYGQNPVLSSVPREVTTFYEQMISRNNTYSTFACDSFEELAEAYLQKVKEILGAISAYREILSQVHSEVECQYLNSLMVEYQKYAKSDKKHWRLSKVVKVDVAANNKDGLFKLLHNDVFDWAYPFRVGNKDIENAAARFRNSDGSPNIEAFEFVVDPIMRDHGYVDMNEPTERKLVGIEEVQGLVLKTLTKAL